MCFQVNITGAMVKKKKLMLPEVSLLSFFIFLLALSSDPDWEVVCSPLLFSPATDVLLAELLASPLLLAVSLFKLAVSNIMGRRLPESSFTCQDTRGILLKLKELRHKFS